MSRKLKLTRFDIVLLKGLASTIDVTTEFADKQTASLNLQRFIGWQPSPSDSVRACRSWKKLEAAGMVKRIPHQWSDITASVQLLPAGREAIAAIS